MFKGNFDRSKSLSRDPERSYRNCEDTRSNHMTGIKKF